MIALYTDGTLTTMNEIISAFDLSSSLIMTGRVVMPKGEMESPVNPVIADIIEIRSLSVSPNFLKTSRYKMLVELPVSIMILFTPAFAIRVEIMRKLCVLRSYLLELVAIGAVFAGVSVGEPTVGTPLTTGSGRGEKGAELRERLRLCALASLKLVMFAVGFSLDRPKIPAQRPRCMCPYGSNLHLYLIKSCTGFALLLRQVGYTYARLAELHRVGYTYARLVELC
ncbi:hypothetical protein BHE74_00020831 [Ensete ventricosum]|nr:hypothetical protein BHE74_00020831 [Ensete ventricosum]